MSGKPMDPVRLAAVADYFAGDERIEEVLAGRDFWEAEAALEKNCRIETFAALVAARAACLDLQKRLAVAEALGAREAAEVELLRSEVVHLGGELRIRVAKLAASGAP